MTSKVTSLHIDNWYAKPTGHFTIQAGDMTVTSQLDADDCERLFTLLLGMVERRKEQLAEDVRNVETALPAPPKQQVIGSFDNTSVGESS